MDRILIQQIEINKILYDKSSKDFKNNKKKLQVWEEIALSLNTTVDVVQRRWKILRDRFSKERREMLNIPSGAAVVESEWEFYKELLFLEPFVRNRKTYSNVDNEEARNSPGPAVAEITMHESPNTQSRSLSPFHYNVFVEEALEVNLDTDNSSELFSEEKLQNRPTKTTVETTTTCTASATSQASSKLTSIQAPSASTPKRRREEISSIDNAITSVTDYLKNKTAVDSDVAFGQYVGAELRKMPKRKKNLAKIKITQIFDELDSD